MDDDDFYADDFVSKTQLKKEAHAQQDLGERLTQLPESVLTSLPLEESLLAALREFKRLPPKHGALKRQRQFIGKLMRDSDSDAIREALDRLLAPGRPTNDGKLAARKHLDTILASGDEGIQAVLNELPSLDRQKTRHFLRAFHGAKSDEKKAAAERKLLDYLFELQKAK